MALIVHTIHRAFVAHARLKLGRGKETLYSEEIETMDTMMRHVHYLYQLEPHKAVAEVSKIGNL